MSAIRYESFGSTDPSLHVVAVGSHTSIKCGDRLVCVPGAIALSGLQPTATIARHNVKAWAFRLVEKPSTVWPVITSPVNSFVAVVGSSLEEVWAYPRAFTV